MLDGFRHLIERRMTSAARAGGHVIGRSRAGRDGWFAGTLRTASNGRDSRPVPPKRLGGAGQALRLAGIVQVYCADGARITELHGRARIKVDAAEYSFASMLDELSGVMTKLPTGWAPGRLEAITPAPFAANAPARAA